MWVCLVNGSCKVCFWSIIHMIMSFVLFSTIFFRCCWNYCANRAQKVMYLFPYAARKMYVKRKKIASQHGLSFLRAVIIGRKTHTGTDIFAYRIWKIATLIDFLWKRSEFCGLYILHLVSPHLKIKLLTSCRWNISINIQKNVCVCIWLINLRNNRNNK